MTRLLVPLVFLLGLGLGYVCSRVLPGPDCTLAPQMVGRHYIGPGIVCPAPWFAR